MSRTSYNQQSHTRALKYTQIFLYQYSTRKMCSLELRIFATYPQEKDYFKTSYETENDYASYYCDGIDSVIIQKIGKLASNFRYDQNEKCIHSIKDYNDQEVDTIDKFPYECETENVSSNRKNSNLKSDISVANMVEINIMKYSNGPNEKFSSCQDENTIRDLKIPYKPPRFQEYDNLTKRISSFTNCPDLIQSAYSLGEAGFFYASTGKESLIKCFHCGGSIKNWDPEDDPWIEHAHWFPKCVFLRQNKDKEFIDLIQQLSSNQQGEFENDTQEPEILALELDTRKDLEGTNVDRTNQVQGLQTKDISTNSIMADKTMCKVCMDGDISIVFLPCGHLATCAQCSPAMKNCPICRQNINGTLRAFLS
ncbi:hypothetical protein KUTeg_007792 [Tegillarca granosa]|uniref:RING-type domain-containing protein n=1 Tax=Tegillarca granosa TaxID=220873 RepID=A0ABQ9FI97_TEGGR|nr:hypothetical protein KUTeg_007792 [Tegillarca granosa]